MRRPNIVSSLPEAAGEQYARVPESLLFDTRLKPIDIRVFGVIVCGLWRGNFVYPDQTALAAEIGSSRRQIVRSISRLKAGGYLKQTPKKTGRLVSYVVTSPIFLRGKDEPMFRTEKHGGRRMV